MENKRPYWQVGIRLLFESGSDGCICDHRNKSDRVSYAVCDRMDYFRSGGSACKLAGKAAAYSEKAWFGVDRYPRSRRNRR